MNNRIKGEARKVRDSNKQPAEKIVAGHPNETSSVPENEAGRGQSMAGKAADNLQSEARK